VICTSWSRITSARCAGRRWRFPRVREAHDLVVAVGQRHARSEQRGEELALVPLEARGEQTHLGEEPFRCVHPVGLLLVVHRELLPKRRRTVRRHPSTTPERGAVT
jgi:hypothetical protein